MGKCPRRKQNEEPKCKNCWENGIKTEANHEAFSNKCKNEAGIISIYFEGDEDIEPYHQNEKGLQKSGNRKSDHSWRHKCLEPLGGEAREKTGGAKLIEISWTKWASTPQHGSTPTFETYRAIGQYSRLHAVHP
ncbi:hypothetical protein EVAR_85870_1 [Eumeta japonica]|uniref:Uncharacterized protein n=1 Tax=Eumeta variegata TaxID=151549 RepID=A0A4C2A3V4_EUMVA|nr:hypothetical protein EVAR_85870_1 [Eumeta japonica]